MPSEKTRIAELAEAAVAGAHEIVTLFLFDKKIWRHCPSGLHWEILWRRIYDSEGENNGLTIQKQAGGQFTITHKSSARRLAIWFWGIVKGHWRRKAVKTCDACISDHRLSLDAIWIHFISGIISWIDFRFISCNRWWWRKVFSKHFFHVTLQEELVGNPDL